ncbi:MAG: HAD family hydrolase [Bacteroidetes bacterium]|nr:HAD family hydrolase [Bacteroidota bacterium]
MDRNGIAVFLDRDGTINEEVEYLINPEQLALIPQSAAAIKKFNLLNIPVFVVSNQSAIARGILTENKLEEIHKLLSTMLLKEDAHITKYYYCPHLIDGVVNNYAIDCNCRKPKLGMLQKAKDEFGINLNSSFIVGDKLADVQTGFNAGMKSILVETGYGIKHKTEAEKYANYVTKNLYEASLIIEKLLS